MVHGVSNDAGISPSILYSYVHIYRYMYIKPGV